jgi:hypothetical protein
MALSLKLLSAPPCSPFDGQEIYYQVDTNGTIWHLRYRTGSASTYKWEYLGGTSISDEITTTTGTISDTVNYVDGSPIGPSVTIPLAGEYKVELGAMWNATGANQGGYVGFKNGAASITDGARVFYPGILSGSTYPAHPGQRTIRRATVTAAGTVCKLQYKAWGGDLIFTYRFLMMTPVRVG